MTTDERINRALTELDRRQDCPSCGGDGYLIEEANEPDEGHKVWQVTCPTCHGEGGVVMEPCIACGAPLIEGQPRELAGHDDGCPVLGEEVR